MVGSIAFDGVNVLYDADDRAAPMAPLYRMESPPHATSIVDHKRLPPLASYMDSTQFTEEYNAESATAQQSKWSANARATTDIELRRQLNRTHQARYKMKQLNKVTDLENGIQALKEEIQDLKLQRQVICFGVPERHTRWGVAAEYFRLFRNGIKALEIMNCPAKSGDPLPC